MSFDSFADFLAMGGHGLYVWLCYGVGFVVLAANLLGAKQARKSLVKELAQKIRRDEQLKEQQSAQMRAGETN